MRKRLLCGQFTTATVSISSFNELQLYAMGQCLFLPLPPVRVKGGMSLRNGMWHGLRNDIIMRNVKYGNGAKK